jgi:hypothetical protein
MAVDVTLAGVLMDGATADPDGVVWTVEEIGGWDSAPVRIDDDEPTGRHGGYGPERLYAARQLTVTGLADCPSLSAAFSARDRLHLMQSGSLEVFEPTPKMVTVVSGGAPRASDPLDGGRTWFNFQIPLTAQNPFKRALTATTVAVAAGSTVSHTADGLWVAEIEVTCTTTGTVDLTIAGLRLRTGSLNAGVKLTSGPGFTNPKRTIISSTGVNLFGLIVQPMQWPAISPGVNSIHQAGSADLSIRYFPTYA